MPDKNQDIKTKSFDLNDVIEATTEHQVMHNHLLVIAVDYYTDENIPNLNNCIKDAESLIQVLKEGYWFKEENIFFLRSRTEDGGKDEAALEKIAAREKEEKRYAYVGEATHENIIAQLRKLATDFNKKLQQAKKDSKPALPKDNVIIFFSGHGIYDEVLDEGYWIPCDGIKNNNSSYIENSTIRTILKAIQAHHTVLISDSCYSGTLFSSGFRKNLSVPRVYQHASRWGLTAGRKNQTVSDGINNSPFAEKMIKILARKQEVWIGDLGSEIIKEIGESELQTPMSEPLSNLRGHDGGQFVFLPRLATEKDYWKMAWRENTRKGYYAFLARYPNGEYEEAALEALNVLASGKTPVFSQEALNTYDFLSEEGVLPGHAKSYVVNFLKGISRSVLSDLGLEMYRDLLKHFPGIGKNQLKSFVLSGRNFAKQQEIEKAYRALLMKDARADKKAFFRFFFDKQEKRNPYKGLQPYEVQDSELFFGRKAVIQDLSDKLRTVDVLLLTGPPGSGKTSVVQAGLFPLLQERDGYELLAIRPGAPPYRQLVEIAGKIDPSLKQVLFVDQYEELFAQSGRSNRKDFEHRLMVLRLADKNRQLKVVLALRSNFEGQMRDTELGHHFWDGQMLDYEVYRLPSMQANELREVILGPAWSNSCDFESDRLVDTILKEVQNTSNALTLLSFSLHKLYELTGLEQRVLTAEHYKELGGINAALNNFAGSVYASLDQYEQRIMRKIFLRMVHVTGGDYSSRRIALEELERPNERENAVAEGLLKRLEKDGQIFLGMDEQGRQYAEPIHDLLISSWSQCRQWIEAFGQENLLLQRELWRASIKSREEAQGRALFFSQFWDNHPKLAQVLDHVLETGTPSLLVREENPLNRRVEALQQELTGDDRQRFRRLMEKWKANGKPEYLDNFIMTGASGKLLAIFLQHGDHWLNKTEADFIQRSWEKRSADIASLYRQRDEAEAARREAEAGQKEIAKLLHKSAVQTQAFKSKYQEQTRKDLLFIQHGFYPDLYLILVGIDNYQDDKLPKLTSCVKDAQTIAGAFQAQQGKLYKRVHSYLLSDEMATKVNILSRVEKVCKTAGIFDFVVVFFAGHGAEYLLDSPDEGINGKDGLFLPYDFDGSKTDEKKANETALSGRELCTRLMAFQSKAFLILEIAYGGSFLSTLLEASRSDDLARLTNNVFGLSACSPGEQAYESETGGLLSAALAKSFSSQEADLDSNGVVYLDELLQFTSKEVRRQAEQNVFAVFPPTIANIPVIQLTDIFALPKKEIAFSGHIEEDQVIEGVMFQAMETKEISDLANELLPEVYTMLKKKHYDKVIDYLLPNLK